MYCVNDVGVVVVTPCQLLTDSKGAIRHYEYWSIGAGAGNVKNGRIQQPVFWDDVDTVLPVGPKPPKSIYI